MLISIATGLGMQYEIRNKISAFNGDISIYNFQTTNYEDSSIPLDFDQRHNLSANVDYRYGSGSALCRCLDPFSRSRRSAG